AVWLKVPATAIETELATGLDRNDLQVKGAARRQAGYWPIMISMVPLENGQPSYTVIWSKPAGRRPPAVDYSTGNWFTDNWLVGVEAEYSGENYLADLQVDVQLSRATPPPSGRERSIRRLADTEKRLQVNPDDTDARLERAWAYHYLRE